MQFYIMLLSIAMLLTGCLVNEPFVRTYNVEIGRPNASPLDIELFFSEQLLSKGLLVKRKYSVLYPVKSHYSIYEIRSRNENNSYGYPTITLLINEGGKVYIQQEEWSVQPTQPIPTDYIAELKDDLEHKWNQIHKRSLKIEIVNTVDPYRGFAHDN